MFVVTVGKQSNGEWFYEITDQMGVEWAFSTCNYSQGAATAAAIEELEVLADWTEPVELDDYIKDLDINLDLTEEELSDDEG